MALLSSASPKSFHDDECFTFQDGDDSGVGSSPATPSTEDDDLLADLFDLDPTFCDSLNSSLFDGEFPVKPYTHIKIKEDDGDEMWLNGAFPRPFKSEISPCAEGTSSPSDEYFDDSFELLAELFSPKAKLEGKETEEIPEVESLEKISTDSSLDGTNSGTCVAAEERCEDTPSREGSSVDYTDVNSCKHGLRARRKRVQVDLDHDYCKSNEPDSSVDSDEDYIVDKDDDEDSDVDDEDYKAPCPAKKARRTNSKSAKDAKYWERRQRNNLAAKRSREAKRAREIQVAKKTAALEKENANLKKQVRKLKADIKRAEKMLRLMV